MPIERTAIFVHRPRRIEELTDSGDTGCGQGTVGSVLPCVLVQCRRFPFGVLTAARDGWVEWATVLDDPGERGERGKSCPRDPA